ncbi:MAG: M48 family metallopeptidase [Desulfobaccales bacterium]
MVLHAPQGLSRAAVCRIIEKNLAWIEKKRAALREAQARVEAGKAYFRGQAFPLALIRAGQDQVSLTGGLVRVSVETPATDPWPRLVSWYCRQAETFLTQSVRQFSGLMQVAPPPLELRSWRRRWGECRADGRLRFNWRLILLPPEILDYVVVHELAHLLIPGHPPRFWQEVRKYLSDYDAHRRWLKLYGGPFLFWRFAPQEFQGISEPG